MRRVAVTLALSLVVGGCGPLPELPQGSAMEHMLGDAGGWPNCQPVVWVTGVITPDEYGNAAIRADLGGVHPLVWGSANTAVVEWGRRYRIGGQWFNGPPTLWACGGADAVIPQ